MWETQTSSPSTNAKTSMSFFILYFGLLTSVLVPPAPPSGAQAPPSAEIGRRGLTEKDFPRLHRLADGVYAYEGLHVPIDGERITTVSFFVVTAEGVLVADGQGTVEETRRLVDTIARITPAPIRYVVVCSDHGDHTGGNAAFPQTATFLAHPTSKRNLERRAIQAGSRVLVPMETVSDEKVLRLGGREIRVRFAGRGHTAGDLHVYLPRERILFMSETFLNRIFPAMRSAYPSEWVALLRRAEALEARLYVPGHGFVDSAEALRSELVAYRRAVERVIETVEELYRSGLSETEAVEKADFGELAQWALAGSQAPIAVRRVYAELEGRLPD